MDYYKGVIPIIDDSPSADVTDLANPKGVCYGYEERDYKLYPKEMFSAPSEMVLIPQSEWDARFVQCSSERRSHPERNSSHSHSHHRSNHGR
jgi:hypothetical protein